MQPPPKLALSLETLKTLTHEQAAQVAGACPTVSEMYSCMSCRACTDIGTY